jgi:hypothetical protein
MDFNCIALYGGVCIKFNNHYYLKNNNKNYFIIQIIEIIMRFLIILLFFSRATQAEVILASLDGETGKSYESEQLIPNEQYNSVKIEHDIGLVKLKTEVAISGKYVSNIESINQFINLNHNR